MDSCVLKSPVTCHISLVPCHLSPLTVGSGIGSRGGGGAEVRRCGELRVGWQNLSWLQGSDLEKDVTIIPTVV